MVLVAMGDDEPLYLLNVLLQISHIGDTKIYAQHIIAGKRQTAVYDDNAVLILNSRDIQSDLLKSP